MKVKTKPLLIRGGRVIDPAHDLDALQDLLVRDGRIAEIAKPGSLRGDFQRLDATGLVVAPGFIDLHVHLREPGQAYKETIAAGTAAAAAGGFTSVCCMPNTDPVNDSPEITRWLQSPDRGAQVNVFPVAAATIGSNGEQLTDFAALQDAGALAVTDDGKPILRDDIMRKALAAAKKLRMPVIQHAEDTRISNGCTIHQGKTAFRLGLRGMSVDAESAIVERDIALAAETGAQLHVAHISTKRAVGAVSRGKAQGLDLTCEATPHHFTLIDEHIGEYNTNFKMCPPLRPEGDRDAVLQGVLDGTIDCIATDHAPHSLHEKQQEFERAPNGITGLETALGIACQVLHHHAVLSLTDLIALFTSNPAQVIGLKARGTLLEGAPADITVFDPAQKWTFSAAESKSKSRNTPFDGWQLTGKVRATVVAGKIVFKAAETRPLR